MNQYSSLACKYFLKQISSQITSNNMLSTYQLLFLFVQDSDPICPAKLP